MRCRLRRHETALFSGHLRAIHMVKHGGLYSQSCLVIVGENSAVDGIEPRPTKEKRKSHKI